MDLKLDLYVDSFEVVKYESVESRKIGKEGKKEDL